MPPLCPPKREYNAVSAEMLTKFGNIVGVETSRYCRSKVLAAKHTASLQLLCTVGGNQARLDARTEFKNLEPSPITVQGCVRPASTPPSASAPKFYIRYAHPISLGCHQLYIVIVANGCGCTQGLFLVALENYSGWPGELNWSNSEDSNRAT